MTTQFTFEARQSRFTAQAFASGLLSVFAHSPTLAVGSYTGVLRFDPEAPDDPGAVSLRVNAKADSLAVTDDLGDKDRREIEAVARDQVLEAAKYPEVTFESDDATATKAFGNTYRVRFKGKLSLHGVSKGHDVEAQVNLLDDAVRLTGECTVSQAAFGIKPVKAAGGAITTKDQVKVAFDVVAKKGDVSP